MERISQLAGQENQFKVFTQCKAPSVQLSFYSQSIVILIQERSTGKLAFRSTFDKLVRIMESVFGEILVWH